MYTTAGALNITFYTQSLTLTGHTEHNKHLESLVEKKWNEY